MDKNNISWQFKLQNYAEQLWWEHTGGVTSNVIEKKMSFILGWK